LAINGSPYTTTAAATTTVIDMGKQKNGGNGVLDGKGVDPAEKKN
jgi:hypothetical protein